MADDPSTDVYNDPDNILTDADPDLQTAQPSPVDQADVSQSPLLPEKDLENADGRGNLDEVDPESHPEHDEMADDPEDTEADADHLSNVIPSDEDDGIRS